MDADIKAKWIEALRSGKYEQTKRVLRRSNDTYCCLGVLCDLVAPEKWGTDHFDVVSHDGTETIPDDDILKSVALGFDTAEGLTIMNDGGKSFAEIADYIEKNL